MKKILFFLKIPPPITGATIINQYILKSKILNNNFKIRSIQISYSKHINDFGFFSLYKFLVFTKINIKLFYELLIQRPNLVYFQISPLNIAFIRDFIFVLIIKTFRIKIVYHLHGKGIDNQCEKYKIIKLLYKIAFKNQFVICLSELLTFDIKKVYKSIPFIVPNAIAIKDPNSKKNKKDNNKVVLLFLSNLYKSKGILNFIDALEILKLKDINFNAYIIGNETDISFDNMNKILFAKNLSHVTKILGEKNEVEKTYYLNNSDIFVFPTLNDVWGLVILEAMQVGLPVISTYEGAIPEIVEDGKTGFLVEKQNPQQLAEKIEVLIKDKKLREKMGRAGRKKYLEKYTLEIFEKNMLKVFNDILRNN